MTSISFPLVSSSYFSWFLLPFGSQPRDKLEKIRTPNGCSSSPSSITVVALFFFFFFDHWDTQKPESWGPSSSYLLKKCMSPAISQGRLISLHPSLHSSSLIPSRYSTRIWRVNGSRWRATRKRGNDARKGATFLWGPNPVGQRAEFEPLIFVLSFSVSRCRFIIVYFQFNVIRFWATNSKLNIWNLAWNNIQFGFKFGDWLNLEQILLCVEFAHSYRDFIPSSI